MDILTRSTIGIGVSTVILGVALSVGYQASTVKLHREIAESIAKKENIVYNAVVAYINKYESIPFSVDALIVGGFLTSTENDNGDGGPFSIAINPTKGKLSIETIFRTQEIMDQFLASTSLGSKPFIVSGMTVQTDYVLPSTKGIYSLVGFVGQFPPSPVEHKRWYDTSSGSIVLKQYDPIAGAWKAVTAESRPVPEMAIYGSPEDLANDIIVPPKEGDDRYAYSAASKTMQKYTYYNTKWVLSGGGVTANLGVGVNVQDLPEGFLKIPGSENHVHAAGGIASAKGWAIMKWLGVPYKPSEWPAGIISGGVYGVFFGNGNTALHLPPGDVTSRGNYEARVSWVSQVEAENICKNYLSDQSGNKIIGGHLIDLGLWKIMTDDIASQPVNWSGGAIGIGKLSAGSWIFGGNIEEKLLNVQDNYRFDSTIGGGIIGYDKRVWMLSNGGIIHDLTSGIVQFMFETLGGYGLAYTNSPFNTATTLAGKPISPSDPKVNIANATLGQQYVLTGVDTPAWTSGTKRSITYGSFYNDNGPSGLFHIIGGTSVENSLGTRNYYYGSIRCVYPIQ